jgi:hypothetical protein
MESRTADLRNGGWGYAALVTLLALACATGAWYIHTETYRSPNDIMFRQRGNATPTGGSSAPAGGEAAAH